MPKLNLVGVLLNPTIAGEAITVTRRFENVSPNGRSTTANVVYNGFAGVSPTADNSLVRDEAFQTNKETIKVITSFKLRGAEFDPNTKQNCQPDLVFWEGNYYVVKVLNDFSHYGRGFVEADCIQIDYIGEAPSGGIQP